MTSRIMSETGYTVQVTNLSSRVSENDLHEFFSFSGPIEHIELIRWFFFTFVFLRESKSDVSRPFFILDKCHIDFLIKKDNCYLRHVLSSQTRQSKCIWSKKNPLHSVIWYTCTEQLFKFIMLIVSWSHNSKFCLMTYHGLLFHDELILQIGRIWLYCLCDIQGTLCLGNCSIA